MLPVGVSPCAISSEAQIEPFTLNKPSIYIPLWLDSGEASQSSENATDKFFNCLSLT